MVELKETRQGVFQELDAYARPRGLEIGLVAKHLGYTADDFKALRRGNLNGDEVKVLAQIESYMKRPPEVERLQTCIDRRGLSRTAIAQKMDFNESTISLILRGQYPSYNEKLRRKIDDFLWLQEARAEGLGEGNFQHTRNARQVFDACKLAQTQKSAAIVYGEAGSGKTIAGRRYAHEHSGVVFIDSYIDMPRTSFLRAVHRNIFGTDGRKKDYDSIFTTTLDRLKNSDRLIILDEANQMRTTALHTARNLTDQAGIGLVLMGTRLLRQKLYYEDPGREGEWAQLFSRAVQYNLGQLTRKDSDLLVKDFIKDPPEAVLETLHRIGNRNPRTVVKLIGLSHDLAKAKGERLNPQTIEEASGMLILGVNNLAQKFKSSKV